MPWTHSPHCVAVRTYTVRIMTHSFDRNQCRLGPSAMFSPSPLNRAVHRVAIARDSRTGKTSIRDQKMRHQSAPKTISSSLQYFTWLILCFANFKKDIPSKKRVYLQQFGIIHLPNPDLTYIRNSERETKLYLCPSTF